MEGLEEENEQEQRDVKRKQWTFWGMRRGDNEETEGEKETSTGQGGGGKEVDIRRG
jgi:hypothetical protein